MSFAPIPIILPMVMAALLAGVGKFIPRLLADVTAIATTLSVTLLCAAFAVLSMAQPSVSWLGGWTPRDGIAIGIALVVDPVGASLAAFAALLTLAALIYSWNYFEAWGTLFHALMLLFLAGMIGFCLTGDLFNLFVFFELMSVAAYALSAYKIEEAGPLQGALNFAVTNSVGAFLVLMGIGLLYGRTGALNLAEIGAALAHAPADGLIVVAFIFITLGFLVKAAMAPFHFWLADAHTVSPVPVCVLFSGIMVQLGLYAVARIYWTIFHIPLAHNAAIRGFFLAIAITTVVIGSLMCFAQHNLKRLLAFSTIAHSGLLLLGIAALAARGLAGTLIYIFSHGMLKGALFLCTGILLHHYESLDELELYGRASRMKSTAIIFCLAGLGLADVPAFGTFVGKTMIEDSMEAAGVPWITAVFFFASILTSGAILRAASRVFFGWGKMDDRMQWVATKDEKHHRETKSRNKTPAVMLVPAIGLLLGAFGLGLIPDFAPQLELAASRFIDPAAYLSLVFRGNIPLAEPRPAPIEWTALKLALGLLPATGAVALAAVALWHDRIRTTWRQNLDKAVLPVFAGLKSLHNGHVGDYVAWMTLGFGVFGAGLILALVM